MIDGKTWQTLVARAALAGIALSRTEQGITAIDRQGKPHAIRTPDDLQAVVVVAQAQNHDAAHAFLRAWSSQPITGAASLVDSMRFGPEIADVLQTADAIEATDQAIAKAKLA